jgi:hypothetical protein
VSDWTGEELRRAALDALGGHADERARDALVHASVTIVGAEGWDGSAGRVQAHRVTLGVDARTLGGLRAAPAVNDALCAALAAAIAMRQGQTLLDLDLRWARGARPSSAGYRDAPPVTPEASLLDALIDYLGAGGEDALARLLGGATIDVTVPGEVTVRLPSPAREAVRAEHRSKVALTAALRDLLGDESARVHLR